MEGKVQDSDHTQLVLSPQVQVVRQCSTFSNIRTQFVLRLARFVDAIFAKGFESKRAETDCLWPLHIDKAIRIPYITDPAPLSPPCHGELDRSFPASLDQDTPYFLTRS